MGLDKAPHICYTGMLKKNYQALANKQKEIKTGKRRYMTCKLTFTGFNQTRTERINHLVNQINYDPNETNHQIVEIEEILTAISILMNLTDEEYKDNVDAYYDKFSEYLYQDLEFKD